jgi:hypothetical protein
VITRKSSLLLNLFNVRVVVNGCEIYQLDRESSVVIGCSNNRPRIVVTNGFHHSPCFEVMYNQMQVYYFNVVCALDDNLLAAGSLLLVLLYVAGLTSGIVLLKVLSFLPIFYFLYIYYINRKEFIQVRMGTSI